MLKSFVAALFALVAATFGTLHHQQPAARPAAEVPRLYQLTVVNDFFAAPTTLIAGTRFETADGHIFRSQQPLIVPGESGATHGTVQISATAEEPGNSPAGRLTIPGLAASPQKYAHIYAEATPQSNGQTASAASPFGTEASNQSTATQNASNNQNPTTTHFQDLSSQPPPLNGHGTEASVSPIAQNAVAVLSATKPLLVSTGNLPSVASAFISRKELTPLLNQFGLVVSLLPQTLVTREFLDEQTDAIFESMGRNSRIDLLSNATLNNVTVNGISGITANDLPEIDLTTKVAGTLPTTSGGTSNNTAPSFGQLLLGNSSGGYDLVATSSLGITGTASYSFAYPFLNAGNVISLAYGTTTTNLWGGLQTFLSGVVAAASTTIGAGTQSSGLVISGGATTTLDAAFGGRLVLYNSLSNVAIGSGTLLAPTSGSGKYNIAIGQDAFASVTSGNAAVAIGYQAGQFTTTARTSTLVGHVAGQYLQTGSSNTAIGGYSMRGVATNPITGGDNTCLGEASCIIFGGGVFGNTGLGFNALFGLIDGDYNTAVGDGAGLSLTTTAGNTLMGTNAYEFGQGTNNVVLGYTAAKGEYFTFTTSAISSGGGQTLFVADTSAMNVGDTLYSGPYLIMGSTITAINPNVSVIVSNPLLQDAPAGSTVYDIASPHTGSGMVAVGYNAAASVQGSIRPTAVGYEALQTLTTGTGNAAFGALALKLIATTTNSTALGDLAGQSLLGNSNTAVGHAALKGSGSTPSWGDNNTAVGDSALTVLTTGSNNIALGKSAGSSIATGSGNILIGVSANATSSASSNYLNIGNALYGTQLGSTAFALGIGTSSPYRALSVNGAGIFGGDVVASFFTATSTAVASQFPYASSTAISVSGTGTFGTASTTNLTVSSLGSWAGQCLTATPSGAITGTTCGGGGGTAITVTSNSANALVVGPNGSTNPVFNVDASVTSQATGLSVQGVAAGTSGGTILSTISSGANEDVTLKSKGAASTILDTGSSGSILARINGGTRLTINNTQLISSLSTTNSASTIRYDFRYGADAALTASTEAPEVVFNSTGTTRTHAGGALSLQRDVLISGATHAFASASTLTNLAALSINLGSGGSNATVTNNHGLYIPSAAVANTTNSYGITVNAATGATNNFAAQFLGGNVGIGTTSPWRTLAVNGTVAFAGLTSDTADQKALCLTATGEVVANTGSSCITSSQRFKTNIEPLATSSGLAETMALSPVSFDYKPEIGIPGTQVGFIAEAVQAVDPRLVVLDASGTPFTVRYENLTAILAKAVQEIASISGAFRDHLIAWLGDATNGIHDLYAAIVHAHSVKTDELCVGATCISPAQFQAMVAAAGQSGTAPSGQGSEGTTTSSRGSEFRVDTIGVEPPLNSATFAPANTDQTSATTQSDPQSDTTTNADGSVSPPPTPPGATPAPAPAHPSTPPDTTPADATTTQ